MGRRPNCGKGGLRVNKGSWTTLEDRKLIDYVMAHGDRRWSTVAREAGLERCAKSCRLRWLNYLRPDIKRGNITEDEEDLIIRLHKLLGNRWSLIAERLTGRTDNEIKNYWNTYLTKKQKASRSVNVTVDYKQNMMAKRAESELPFGQGLLDEVIVNSDPLIRGAVGRSLEGQNSEFEKINRISDNAFSPAMAHLESLGEFKTTNLVNLGEDIDLSGIELIFDISSLADGELISQSPGWFPDGFLENWSSHLGSGEDWMVM